MANIQLIQCKNQPEMSSNRQNIVLCKKSGSKNIILMSKF